jgi:hypothetical protein
MKHLIKMLCVVLVVIGGVWAQELTAYEKKFMDLFIAYCNQSIKDYGNAIKSAGIEPNTQRKFSAVKAKFDSFANKKNDKNKIGEVYLFWQDLDNIIANDLTNYRSGSGAGSELYDALNFLTSVTTRKEKLLKDIEAAKSLMNAAERAAEKEKEEKAKMLEWANTFLYSEIFLKAGKYFSGLAPVKGQFESTEDFNKRLSAHQDSAKFYFDKFVSNSVEKILTQLNGTSKDRDGNFTPNVFVNLDVKNYNADKGTWAVVGSIKSVRGRSFDYDGARGTDPAELKISGQEAQSLSKGYSLSFDQADIYMLDYVVYPTKLTLVNNADGKRYIVDFPRKQDGQDIVFNGSELWKDNPKAKTLTVNYKDALVARNQQREEQREQAKIVLKEQTAAFPEHIERLFFRNTVWDNAMVGYNVFAVGLPCQICNNDMSLTDEFKVKSKLEGGFIYYDGKIRFQRFNNGWEPKSNAIAIFEIELGENAVGQNARIITKIKRVGELTLPMLELIEANSPLTPEEIKERDKELAGKWARRMNSKRSGWILRTADNQIKKFVIGEQFPIAEGTYEIQGKKVKFKQYDRKESREFRYGNTSLSDAIHMVCSITDQNGKECAVLAWRLKSNGKIEYAYDSPLISGEPIIISEKHGFLGYGIFDTSPENFPPLK